MANQLKMAAINSILTLHKSGKSQREIARLLGVHRETVAKYVAREEADVLGHRLAVDAQEPRDLTIGMTGLMKR